jgi:multiple antibiotic resistance protein
MFVAFDVVGLLPVYVKYTVLMDSQTRDRHLRDSLFTSFLTASIFVIVGNRVMSYLGISINDFLVAGGIVIFITAIKEIITRPDESEPVSDMFGVVPLGIPLLAGPAVLAASLIVWSTYPFYYFLVSLLLNIIICGVVLKFSGILMKFMGRRLVEALSRVFSLVVASIAVMFIRRGLQL